MTFSASAERPTVPRPGTFSLGTQLDYFKTSSNYDSSGQLLSLYGGANYQNISGTANFGFDWSHTFRSYASLSYTGAQVTNDIGTKTNSGFNEVKVGTLAWFNAGIFSIAPEIDVITPFWRVKEDNISPLIGEGSFQVQGGSWVILRLQNVQPYAFAGYDFLDGGRASLLPYSVGINFKPNQWWIEGSLNGYTSVVNDSAFDFRFLRDIYLGTVNGGSYRYYAINPNYGEIDLASGIELGEVRIFAGVGMSVYGNTAANGWTVSAGISFNPRLPDFGSPQLSEEEQFKPKKVRYDESLFKETDKTKIQDRQKVKRKRRKKPSVNKMIHETVKELNEP